MNLTDEQIRDKIEELEKKKITVKLNEKIKQSLSIIGFILSGLGGIGYFATIITLVMGTGNLDFQLVGKDGVFFIIGLAFGIFIRAGFYIQGITYAKQEFKPVLEEYYSKRNVDKKERRTQSFEFKMGIEILINTIIQVVIFTISGVGLIYLAGFEGMNNGVYIGNAISNLFLFAGLGFLALNSSYEKYIIYKIPFIKERIRKIDIEASKPKEIPKVVECEQPTEVVYDLVEST